MTGINLPRAPCIPAALARKGAIPLALLAALSSPLAYSTLERWEGNVLHVYRDKLANGLPPGLPCPTPSFPMTSATR